jgi:hypothetical protein
MSDRDREFREDILFPRCGNVPERIFIPRKLRYDLEVWKSSRCCDSSKSHQPQLGQMVVVRIYIPKN